MLSHDRLSQFSRMEREGEQLSRRFAALTSAHWYFQERAALKSISVSDALDDGSIEVVFMDVRLRFQLAMIFNDDFEPRGQVICMHCRRTCGNPVRDMLGTFTFDSEGLTDLDAGIDGQPVDLHAGAPQIILTFLERAFTANRCV